MKAPNILKATVLIFLVGLAAHSQTASAQTSGGERRDLGIIQAVRGPVCVKQGGQGNCTATKRGKSLRQGDILRVDDTGVAEVRCYCPPPREKPNTSARYEGTPCPNSCPRRLGSGVAASIAILRPEAMVIDRRHFYGIQTDDLSLRGSQDSWSMNDSAAGVDLGNQKFKLEPGVSYTISSGRKRYPGTSVPTLNVLVLNPEEAETVQLIEKEIRAMDLPELEKQIRVAELYATWGITLDSLKILESVQANKAKEPTDASTADVLLTIADLYSSMDESGLAIATYDKAFELAKRQSDFGQQGFALEGLGLVFLKDGKVSQANAKFQEGIVAFEKAGNSGMASKLRQRLPTSPATAAK
ncbi:MAG: hypothetical protein QOK48_2975 [Blastocatellia bacterium]|jgi:hypothetical protein|nr:hypothetical protein [Blastocatellia bacterium]